MQVISEVVVAALATSGLALAASLARPQAARAVARARRGRGR